MADDLPQSYNQRSRTLALPRQYTRAIAVLSRGFRYKEAAEILEISYTTLKSYVRQACIRSNCKTAIELVYRWGKGEIK